MSYMGNQLAFEVGIEELNDKEIERVSGSFGAAGAAIGGVLGGLFGGYNYIANHIGNNNGTGATFGGMIMSVGSGMLGGAIAGGTGTWAGAAVAGVVGVAGSLGSGRLDKLEKHK